MENENKNKSRNKHHKHKPYFITPNGDTQNAQAGASEQKPNANNQKNKPLPKPDTEAQKPQPTPKAEQASTTEKPQGSNKNKRNRNRHKKRPDAPKQEQAVPQSVSASSEEILDDISASELAFPKLDRLEKPAPKKMESFSSSPEFHKYQDYKEFTYAELYGTDDEPLVTNADSDEAEVNENADEPKVEVVGIRFKASGKTYYFTPNEISLRIGQHAIVETARGLEYGEVVMGNTLVPESETVPPLRTVVRAATQADILHNEEIKKLEENAFRVCNEKIIAHELDMKLIDAQYTFDNSKLLFYFTSSGRVDFRELVKDLASVFRTRIELRQIGIRDEAKIVGGLGTCGRPLCCSKFLTDFGQVSIKMAKEQNLSLNSAKISGVCGRLMCCLRYEHETYEYEIKRTPPVDTLVRTVDGVGTVTEISPLQGTIKVRLAATPEVQPKSYKREDVTILKKKN